ncbi:MAG: CDP-glucose 4,6-dehydratase [Gemmatimonadaceae bacterium]|nr:CDP-glucose 4,6-dehydratase [Gemmatimonadaceae bacterium]
MFEALDSFRGKRVAVTGHTGFKGSWLTFILTELGADVMGYALPPASGGVSHFDKLGLARRIRHVVGDVRDPAALSAAISSFKPEYVFHLAAQALVRESYDDPSTTFSTNVMGSVNLLEAVRKCDSVRSLVFVTSDKCYENVEWIWGYRENDQLGGRDPYSASKGAAELVFAAYWNSYFSTREMFGAATARAGNVIGGGDWAKDRIVPDCVRAAQTKTPIRLRNPGSTRPWQHVLEPISGYLLLGAALRDDPAAFGGPWNFGPSTAEVRTVRDVAEAISAHLGGGGVEIESATRAHHEARLLQLNCDKAHQLLGWYPRWTADKTIDATAEWYRTVLQGAVAETVTRSQVLDYFPELQ